MACTGRDYDGQGGSPEQAEQAAHWVPTALTGCSTPCSWACHRRWATSAQRGRQLGLPPLQRQQREQARVQAQRQLLAGPQEPARGQGSVRRPGRVLELVRVLPAEQERRQAPVPLQLQVPQPVRRAPKLSEPKQQRGR